MLTIPWAENIWFSLFYFNLHVGSGLRPEPDISCRRFKNHFFVIYGIKRIRNYWFKSETLNQPWRNNWFRSETLNQQENKIFYINKKP